MESILIKLSGEFLYGSNGFDFERISDFSKQIKKLSKDYKIGLVIGGGNIFRASKQGKILKMNQSNADSAGMIATVINGIVLKDVLEQANVKCTLLSALSIDTIASKISQDIIDRELKNNTVIIFVSGTGNPFFTTDTNAVLRALQIGAKQVWKATKVDGIYSQDPEKNKSAKKIKTVTHDKALSLQLKITDSTALTLAYDNKIDIRVFNVFEPNALTKAAKDSNFGSTICCYLDN